MSEAEKHDQGKDPWDLLPFGPIRSIVKVLAFGAWKYGPNNWQGLESARDRYFAACMRHLEAWRRHELTNEESGLPHLAHALCCLVFLLWFEQEGKDP